MNTFRTCNEGYYLRAVAFGVARHLGIPIVLSDGLLWDGQLLRLPRNSHTDILHEISHWIVAKRFDDLARKNWGVDRDCFADYLGDEVAKVREDLADMVEIGLVAAIEAGAFEIGSEK